MPVKKSELYSSHWASCDELLGDAYATPLPQHTSEAAILETKVSRHLERMASQP
jgi:hypothetical protein